MAYVQAVLESLCIDEVVGKKKKKSYVKREVHFHCGSNESRGVDRARPSP